MSEKMLELFVHEGFGRTEFIKFINNLKPLNGIEIGVYNAENSEIILKRVGGIKYWGVDPYLCYKDYEDDFANSNQEIQDKRYEMANQIFKSYNQTLIRKTSEEASKDFEDNFFDFIYIDANHNYEYIKTDIELWWPKVKAGGILSGHDFSWNYAGNVVRAIMDFAREIGRDILIFQVGSIWIIKK